MLPGMIGEVVQRYAVECLMLLFIGSMWFFILKFMLIVALNIHNLITEL